MNTLLNEASSEERILSIITMISLSPVCKNDPWHQQPSQIIKNDLASQNKQFLHRSPTSMILH